MSDDLGPRFTADEIRCEGSGVHRVHPAFPPPLRTLRAAYGRPMRITSGGRSTAHNAKQGGSRNSWHLNDRQWSDGNMGSLALELHLDAASIIFGEPPAIWADLP